jgi:GNAT superfamily N-acetyltransferase
MSQSFAVRAYQPADEDRVLTLLVLSLGNGRAFARDSAFWQWKHFQNPFGASLLMLADGAEVLGLRAFLRWRFQAEGRVLHAVRAVDTATHPAYRRFGVFTTLTRQTVEQARAEGVDLIFNTPNRYSLPGYLKLGWTYVGRPGVLVRILRPGRMLSTLRAPVAEADEWRLPEGAGRPVGDLLADPEAVRRLLADDDRLRAGRLSTTRSLEFLRWRYTAVPSLTYFAGWSPRRDAAIVFRPTLRRGLREVMLCEVLFGSGGGPALGGVVRGLAASCGADYLLAHAPWGTVHWWALVRAGFLPVPRVGPHFTVRPLSEAGAAVSPARLPRWSLSLGDLEVF